jgi:hypothetical protein
MLDERVLSLTTSGSHPTMTVRHRYATLGRSDGPGYRVRIPNSVLSERLVDKSGRVSSGGGMTMGVRYEATT